MEKVEKEKIKIIVPFCSYPMRNRKFHKNNKNFFLKKYTITDSFQAKIGWKMMRKRENKTIVPFRSVPTRCIMENSKKIKNIKKIPLWLHFNPKSVGKG